MTKQQGVDGMRDGEGVGGEDGKGFGMWTGRITDREESHLCCE